jgi:hypothetical protein
VVDLKQAWFGDADLDGQFNSSDLVSVLASGHYEDSLPGNSTWTTGDWNGDGDFTTSDLITALADGGYEQGPRLVVGAVPEPSRMLLLMALLMILPMRRKRLGTPSRCATAAGPAWP